MIQMWVSFRMCLFAIALLVFLPSGTGSAALPEAAALKLEADRVLKGGRIGRAIALYERALAKDKGLSSAYYNLATAYYLGNDLEKAVENLEAFIRLHPGDTEALYNLGCLKLQLGRFEEARGHFQAALNCPSCPPSFLPKIKEALLFLKDLHNQKPEDRELLTYLLSLTA